MSELLVKQFIFTRSLSKLLIKANALGYEVTIGEVWRTQEQAALNAQTGAGIKNSVHCLRLAVDLSLFKSGALLKESEPYEDLADYWKGLSSANVQFRWGGDFRGFDSRGMDIPKPDIYHYSILHLGVS